MATIMFSGGWELCIRLLEFLGTRIIIVVITMKEAELRKNTAQRANVVTTKPPIVGPSARPMLLATALSVRAAGSSDLDTSPLIIGIMGVLIIVVPAPSAKVNSKSKEGVVFC
jgi:hypothetical protein